MHGLHSEMGIKGLMMAAALELIFLSICLVFVGYGLTELKKGKQRAKNTAIVVLGFVLAGVSLYATKLLIEG